MSTGKERMREKYGKNKKARELFNSDIRAACPGGNELLDLMELVSSMRTRAQNPEERRKLLTIEDRLQGIRDEMVVDVRKRWDYPAATSSDEE